MSVSNPQSSGSQDSIDLDTIISDICADVSDTEERCRADNLCNACVEDKKRLLAWHNTQLYTEVLELIGEDEPPDFHTEEVNGIEGEVDFAAERNEVKRGLRAKATAKWGMGGK
jgi:hypothetical protein